MHAVAMRLFPLGRVRVTCVRDLSLAVDQRGCPLQENGVCDSVIKSAPLAVWKGYLGAETHACCYRFQRLRQSASSRVQVSEGDVCGSNPPRFDMIACGKFFVRVGC